MKQFGKCLFALTAICLASTSVDAAAIQLGATYGLNNHPDGSARPPSYGLRLDELFNETGGNDIFTFDFDAVGSAMFMSISAGGDEIRIFGTVYGGRDTGSSYANDQYLGLYEVDFTYSTGVGLVPGDDDLQVLATMGSTNGGFIAPLAVMDGGPSIGGGPIALGETANGSGMTFRFGDENNDNGHRGFNGFSGWGWISVDGDPHAGQANDWLFTADPEPIPEPATAGLIALGALSLLRRRR